MFKIVTTTAAAATALTLTGFAAMADVDTDNLPAFPWGEAEFLVAVPEAKPGEFVEVDLDGDGRITEEEYRAAIEQGIIDDPHG